MASSTLGIDGFAALRVAELVGEYRGGEPKTGYQTERLDRPPRQIPQPLNSRGLAVSDLWPHAFPVLCEDGKAWGVHVGSSLFHVHIVCAFTNLWIYE
ncbi:hypothetical protein N9F12_01375 [Burkholderiaceae bacterium]|nr:hypothetical protein [Burkholderiaceae bacterium]